SWPNKFHARIGACLGELRVFREEAVARMDGLGARAFGYVEDFVYPQVRLGGGGRAGRVSFVGLVEMGGGAVDVGVDGDGGNAHFAAGADDAHRDLSPVGDQNLLEHSWLNTSRLHTSGGTRRAALILPVGARMCMRQISCGCDFRGRWQLGARPSCARLGRARAPVPTRVF